MLNWVQHLYVPAGILDPETLTCVRAGEFRVTPFDPSTLLGTGSA